MNGFKQQPQSSRKEKIREMEAELKNVQMSVRISQMMVQQLLQNNKNMSEDLTRALGLINELQYKTLAIQQGASLDKATLNSIAADLRLKDFEEASNKEDAEKNYTVDQTVNEDSVVIITSTTEEADRGIFRSKIKLAECGVKELVEAFMGREVGARAICMLNGVEHTVELLGIRQPPKEEPLIAVEAPLEVQA
jgi:hypothetical protein